MRRQSVSKLSLAVVAVCGLLAADSSAWADEQDTRVCTAGTLQGDYGYAAEGVLIETPGLPPEAPFRSLGVIHFDGKGNLTWIEHTVVNGFLVLPDGAEAIGIYTVNPDCTGTTVINTPNSPVPLNQHFVIVKRGTEVHTLLDSSAIASVLIKVQ
jgi:hypothetical protein